MTGILETRKKYKDKFQEKHGIKLGFMGFFLKASQAALEEFPRVNAYIDGTDFVYHNYVDIGVAVSTEKGLMVPIIRNVDKMSLAEVEMTINNFAAKARENKISLDDLSGGTFTVSNGGVFGSLVIDYLKPSSISHLRYAQDGVTSESYGKWRDQSETYDVSSYVL